MKMKVQETTVLFTALLTATLLYQTSGAEDSSEGELVWIKGESHVTVDLGATVELSCHVKIPALANVLWVKVIDDGSEIIAHDERLLLENDRIFVNYNSSEGISVLKIQNSNNKDSGRYECQVPMMNTTINAAVEVIVSEASNNTAPTQDDSQSSDSSLTPEETELSSTGHSFTYSVFLVSSFIFFCTIFNVISPV